MKNQEGEKLEEEGNMLSGNRLAASLHFGRLTIETGALYYCIELGWNTGLWFVLIGFSSLKSLFCRRCGQNMFLEK